MRAFNPFTLTMTDRHLEIIRHSLGLLRSKYAYRNHFCAEPGSEDYKRCVELEQAGFMRFGISQSSGYCGDIFFVTQSGAEAVGVSASQYMKANQ